MTRKLSISSAWDEAKSRIGTDGKLFVTVALALIALPAAIGQFIGGGGGMTSSPQSLWQVLVTIIVWVIGLVGQLALIRLAIGQSVSVGEAIGHGARRTPAYIGAVILIIIGIIILTIPFALALAALGVTFEQGATPPPAAYLFLLLYIALMLYVAVRMLLTSPVASAEAAGPVAIIKRSWQITSGNVLRLLGFILLFIVAVIVFVGAVSMITSLVVGLLFGEIEPMTAGALIVALAESVASAIATTVFIVMLARIYVQLTGDAPVETSVPSSGT